MRLQLANVSRVILDLLIVQTSENQDGIQAEFTEVALEIVVELLEKICYEKEVLADGRVHTFMKMDDVTYKEQYIQLLTLFSELTQGSDTKQDRQATLLSQNARHSSSAQLLANMVLHV